MLSNINNLADCYYFLKCFKIETPKPLLNEGGVGVDTDRETNLYNPSPQNETLAALTYSTPPALNKALARPFPPSRKPKKGQMMTPDHAFSSPEQQFSVRLAILARKAASVPILPFGVSTIDPIDKSSMVRLERTLKAMDKQARLLLDAVGYRCPDLSTLIHQLCFYIKEAHEELNHKR